MDDPADYLAIATRLNAATVLWDRILDQRELLIRQPEQVRHQPPP